MADELFNVDNLNNARGATQAMVDNLQELRKLGGEFAGEFGRDFLANANAINKAFNDAIGKAEQFNTLEVSRKEALNVEKKLREEIAKSQANLATLTGKIDGILKPQFERTAKILLQKKAEYSQAVQNYGLDSQQAKLALLRVSRADDLNQRAKKAYELGLNTIELTQEQIEEAKKLGLTAAQYAENWDKANLALGVVGKLVKGIGKIPIVGDLFNANQALAVMQKEVIKGESTFKAFGKGISAAFQGLEKSTVILGIIAAVVKAVQFLVDLFLKGQDLVVNISRQLGISQQNAAALADRFRDVADSSGNILANMKSVTEAQINFTKELGASTYLSDDLLQNQVLLTKNLGLSAETSAKLGMLFEYSGKGSRTVFNNVNNLNTAAAKVNGFIVPLPELFNKIASASAEVAGYMGFNVESLAKAVIQTTKFGVSLQQANTIAKGLLDFETSIGAELEAELLTGKEFNLELARSKALQGDVAGASADVLRQMQSLTAEQRKSPIIMESIAKATGLSVEELNQAYLRQTRLTSATRAYTDELRAAGKEELAQLAEKYGIAGMTEEQIKKNVTAQEAFQAALEKVKDQFTILDKSGAIEKLTKLLIDFVNTWAEKGLYRAIVGEPKPIPSAGTGAAIGMAVGGPAGMLGGFALGAYNSATSKEVKVDDFTIQTNPKDTLVMAGGTKFGEETNTLLKELISAVKTPNNQISNNQIAQAVTVSMGVYERGVN